MSHENQSRTLISLGLVFVIVAHMTFLNLPSPWNLWVATPLAVGGLTAGFYGLWLWEWRRGKQ